MTGGRSVWLVFLLRPAHCASNGNGCMFGGARPAMDSPLDLHIRIAFRTVAERHGCVTVTAFRKTTWMPARDSDSVASAAVDSSVQCERWKSLSIIALRLEIVAIRSIIRRHILRTFFENSFAPPRPVAAASSRRTREQDAPATKRPPQLLAVTKHWEAFAFTPRPRRLTRRS